MRAESEHRLHPAAVGSVAGFPGAIGALALAAALSRSGSNDGAFPLAVVLLAVAGGLLVLGLRSVVRVGPDDLTVRFFGIRATTIRFRDLASATLGMAFPSLSYALTLLDRSGRKALLHANWWHDEPGIVVPVCRALLEHDVPMDRSTARIVSTLLSVPRPRARILHRALVRKDKTW